MAALSAIFVATTTPGLSSSRMCLSSWMICIALRRRTTATLDRRQVQNLASTLRQFEVGLAFRYRFEKINIWCTSSRVVECPTCECEVVGTNAACSYCVPMSTQHAIPPGLVNEYQWQLEISALCMGPREEHCFYFVQEEASKLLVIPCAKCVWHTGTTLNRRWSH